MEDFALRSVAVQSRRDRFLKTLYSGPPDGIEWLLGTLKIVFGAWFLLPFSLFATAPHLYRYAASWPEWVWGSLFCFTGVMQWRVWYFDQKKLRFLCGMLAACLWDFYGTQVWRGDSRTPSLAFLGVIAAGQMLAAIWLYGAAFPAAGEKNDGN